MFTHQLFSQSIIFAILQSWEWGYQRGREKRLLEEMDIGKGGNSERIVIWKVEQGLLQFAGRSGSIDRGLQQRVKLLSQIYFYGVTV